MNVPIVDLVIRTDAEAQIVDINLVGDYVDADIDLFKSMLRELASQNMDSGFVRNDNSRPTSATVVVDRAELEFFSEIVSAARSVNARFVRWYL